MDMIECRRFTSYCWLLLHILCNASSVLHKSSCNALSGALKWCTCLWWGSLRLFCVKEDTLLTRKKEGAPAFGEEESPWAQFYIYLVLPAGWRSLANCEYISSEWWGGRELWIYTNRQDVLQWGAPYTWLQLLLRPWSYELFLACERRVSCMWRESPLKAVISSLAHMSVRIRTVACSEELFKYFVGNIFVCLEKDSCLRWKTSFLCSKESLEYNKNSLACNEEVSEYCEEIPACLGKVSCRLWILKKACCQWWSSLLTILRRSRCLEKIYLLCLERNAS